MTVKLDSYKIYAYIDSAWVELTSVLRMEQGIQCSYGMSTNNVDDRVAKTGSLVFHLNNSSGLYLPGDSTATTDWGKGTVVYIELNYEGNSFKKFRGYVDRIVPTDTNTFREVAVYCVDIIAFLERYPLTNTSIQTNKTGDVAISAITGQLHQQPQATSYATGSFTYPALFDTVSVDTRAISEINKIVQSEGSFFYRKSDALTGETLVFENAYSRNGLVPVKQYPENLLDSNYIVDENNDYLVDENGDRLKYSELCDCVVGEEYTTFDRSNGDGIINRVTITAYPKRTDGTAQVLYNLDSPMFLASGETKTFRGRYSNPSGGAEVNAISSTMISPVGTTDYLMNRSSAGTGTNLTANLTVSASYGTEAPIFTVTNSSGYLGYITKLQARGYGVYQDNPIEFTAEDTYSQSIYGLQEKKIYQQYQRDIAFGRFEAENILEFNKTPYTKIRAYNQYANKSPDIMTAFLYVETGDLIQITNTTLGINSCYYIQGIEFTISAGGSIMFNWILKLSLSLTLGLSMIACQFSPTGTTDGVCFGNLKQLVDLPEMTLSAWVYPTAYTKQTVMSGWVENQGGLAVYLGGGTYVTNGVIQVVYYHTGGGGQWVTTETIPLNQWSKISVQIDNTTNTPNIYINGVLATTSILIVPAISYDGTPIGPVGSIDGMDWCIGNIHGIGAGTNFVLPFIGKLKDVRVYNRFLTATEESTSFSDGAGELNVIDGLVFQSPVVKTSEYNNFVDKTLSSTDKLIDNIYGAIGRINGSPITRAP